MSRGTYWVYERPDGHPFVSVVERDCRLVARCRSLAEARAALAARVTDLRRRAHPSGSGRRPTGEA